MEDRHHFLLSPILQARSLRPIESLVEYLTIEQGTFEIPRYVKDDGGRRKAPEAISGKKWTLALESFKMTFSPKEIYAKCDILQQAD